LHIEISVEELKFLNKKAEKKFFEAFLCFFKIAKSKIQFNRLTVINLQKQNNQILTTTL
jgi:hypothetical protein